MKNRLWGRWIVLAGLIIGLGCGGGNAGFQVLDVGNVSDNDASGTFSPDVQTDEVAIPDGESRCKDKREIVILEDTSKPISITVGTSHMISAKVLDFASEGPAANTLVFFEITKITQFDGTPVQSGDAKLSGEAAYTDKDGLVQMVFNAGTQAGLVYTVKLSTKCAQDATIKFSIAKAPVGSMKVNFQYDTGPPLSRIKVSLLPGAYLCTQLAPQKKITSSLYDKTVFNTHSSVQFDNLTAGSRFTVVAVARGPMNMIAAYGCRDGVLILPNDVTKVTLPLYMVVLNPTGKYDSVDHFDFTNVIKDCANGVTDPLMCAELSGGNVGQQVCCALYQMITFFNDPGETIVKLIEDVAKQYLGSLIVDAFNLFADAVSNVISDWLLHHSPQWVQNFFKVGQDLMSIITNLEMYSTLELSKIQNNLTVQGVHYWTGIALYWKVGCNPNDPNYDQCGKHVFSLKDLKNTEFPMDIMGGSFVASVFDFNKMQIHEHKIDFSYGKLVLFVLNEIVLPGVTKGKAHSLKDAMALWLDCHGISQGILGKIAKWFKGSEKDVEKTCNKAVDLFGGFVESFLSGLQVNTNLSLRGQCTLVDKDEDLKVDELKNGHYSGQIETGKGKASSFTGTFEAKKKK